MINYTVNTRIEKTVTEVFEAIVRKDTLNKYFTDDSSGDLVVGEQIIWNWNEWGEFPVTVTKIIENELIVLTIDSKRWLKTKDQSYEVSIIIEFKSLDDGQTMLSISEEGWKTDVDGLMASHDNCSGWTHMAMCLKAYIEHGIDLR